MDKKEVLKQKFIQQAEKIHGKKYNYSKVQYKNTYTRVIINCEKHGDFLQRPNAHINQKQGCPCCAQENRNYHALTTKEFIERAQKIHGNMYQYHNVDYKNAKNKVKINCHKHGVFEQLPFDHLNGSGCPRCASELRNLNTRKTTQQFVELAEKIHNHFYDYKNVNYISLHTPVEIICPFHGSFFQTPSNHIHNNAGCSKCSHTISQKEKLWLDSENVPDTHKNRQVRIYIGKQLFKVDGYIPETKTVYEFYGDFWHGNPQKYRCQDFNYVVKKSFGTLYQNTLMRMNKIKAAGYNFIYIWESEFDKYQL